MKLTMWRVVVILNTYTQFWGKVKWQGRRLTPKSGPDRLKMEWILDNIPDLCRLTYKFYGAWWLRIASWRCFSGFIV